MERALTRWCYDLYNWFVVEIHADKFKIENGQLSCPFLIPGQYFRIVGSILNDGVHQYPAYDLFDEEFQGQIWAMAVPQDFIRLIDDIEETERFLEEWQANPTGFTSESFAGYSYSRAADPYSAAMTHRSDVAKRLGKYRKARQP